MPFSGLSTNKLFTPNLVGEDISPIIATLAPIETPFLDWLGDSSAFATSTKHEYIQDHVLPNYISNSSAINSATAATGILVANDLGAALTVGTLLENETSAEVMQVSSIAGPTSILVSRNYDGSGIGSLAAGGQLYVRGPAGVEGADHDGNNTQRMGVRTANTVGLFHIPVAVSGTAAALDAAILGRDSFSQTRAKVLAQVPSMLEKEVLRGVLNSTNSLGTASATRTMKGLRSHLSSVNSQVTASSFAANPHLYIGNVWESAWRNGASTSEEWGIVAGHTFFRDISNMNDSKVQDSNVSELYKRVIRDYEGPFGRAVVFPSRVLPATELLIVSRQRVRVVPLQGRSFAYQEMGRAGDNTKGLVVGEYTVEVHHESAMARLRV